MDMQKVYCNTYRDVPSLLPCPGEGERQASLSSDVASCRGKDYWKRQSLGAAEKKDDAPKYSINRANA